MEPNVQRTVNLSDALTERIRIIEEDIAKFERDLAGISSANGLTAAKYASFASLVVVGWVLIGILGFLVFVTMVSGTFDVGILLIAGVIGGLIYLGVRYFNMKKEMYHTDPTTAERLSGKIASLKVELQKAKDEKREYFLGFEREMKMQKDNETITVESTVNPDTKECPRCAENVKFRAKVCRFCGHTFELESE